MTKQCLVLGVLWIACGLAFAQTEDKATSESPYTLEVATEGRGGEGRGGAGEEGGEGELHGGVVGGVD